MGLEVGTTIESLDSSWPLGGDVKSQGDNHIRLLKEVLKATFPGVGGNGFNVPIIAKEDEINFLAGVTSNIQDQLNAITTNTNLMAPSGTVLIFFQLVPPAGWTQLAANNDSMLRVVDTGGGSAGGSSSPISFNSAHTHSNPSFALTINHMPPHTHRMAVEKVDGSGSAAVAKDDSFPTDDGERHYTGSAGLGQAFNIGATLSSGSTFSPRYINVITAVKD